MKTKMLMVGLLLAGLTVVGDCKTTKLLTSWKNPNYAGQRFHKILVIGMSNNPATRSDFEDALSLKIARNGIEAIPGNSILLRQETGKIDLDYLKAQIRENQIDAVVVSRLVKVDRNVTYIPGQSYVIPYGYYRSFYGYYGAVYQQVYSPDYLREDTTVRIETNLYAATPPDGELIWTGTSDTFNPKSAHKVIDALIKLVVKELEKEAIL
ncbi:MAG: hypothetical protein LAO31_18455 [Acidobacteriia bacterium]|nr:hypothetical protein [Terriglobia bacterium]